MKEIECPFVFDFSNPDDDDTPMIHCLNGTRYYATKSGGGITHDCGFFGKFRNPHRSSRHVILACGIETARVRGVVNAFSEDQSSFLKLHESILRKQEQRGNTSGDIEDLFALMEFEVEYDNVHSPTAAEQISNIVCDWESEHNGLKQDSPPR